MSNMSRKKATKRLTRPLRLWVNALRSGKYRQGDGCLRTAEGAYCCLGVACEVFRLHAQNGSTRLTRIDYHDNFSDYVYEHEGESSVLPDTVVRWLGVPDYDPHVTINGRRTTLMQLNDEDKLPFSEIADAIEDYFGKELPAGQNK